MKLLRSLLFAIFASVAVAADAPNPAFPAELRLTSGATLRRCEVVRWTADSVVVRHAGGIDPVRFTNIAADQRGAVESARKAAVDLKSAQGKPTPPATNASKERIYKGQVFVATRGGKSEKLGSVNVRAFAAPILQLFDGVSDTINLPKPLASTVTDADGKFVLNIPGAEPFFIFAQSGRFIGGRVGSEVYDWRIPSEQITEPDNVLLNNRNMAQRNFNVTVAAP